MSVFAPALLGLLLAPPALAAPTPDDHPWSASLISGFSVPINGLNYNAGVGLRGGRSISVGGPGGVYVGGMAALHQGDRIDISYGSVTGLGIEDGGQAYRSHPKLLAADVGYELPLPLPGPVMRVTPYLSLGLLATRVESDGVYGESAVTNRYLVAGGGFSLSAELIDHFAIGPSYRMYNVGDTEFEFGDLDEGEIEHGFSTSIFYAAFYGELTARF